MTLLRIEDLHVAFESPRGLAQAVNGVSLEVGEGETIGVVGESGCGKSVTARSVMRLLPSKSSRVGPGTIRFKGNDLLRMSENAFRNLRGNEIAMIFQNPMTSLNPVLSIGEQIGEALRRHMRLSKRSARRRVIEVLESVGIPGAEDRYDSYPHEFSGGMRQRVMIAMALSCNPKVIMADEVTTALDVTIQAQILELLKDLTAKTQTSLVMITHDLGVVAGMTQRVYIMYGGRVVETADTATLFADSRMPYTWGLLRSIPRLDADSQERLVPIEGSPPDPAVLQRGCRFEARCPFRRDICRDKEPELITPPNSSPKHQVRCWGTQDVEGGGWLIGYDPKDSAEAFSQVASVEPEGRGDVPRAPGTDEVEQVETSEE